MHFHCLCFWLQFFFFGGGGCAFIVFQIIGPRSVAFNPCSSVFVLLIFLGNIHIFPHCSLITYSCTLFFTCLLFRFCFACFACCWAWDGLLSERLRVDKCLLCLFVLSWALGVVCVVLFGFRFCSSHLFLILLLLLFVLLVMMCFVQDVCFTL